MPSPLSSTVSKMALASSNKSISSLLAVDDNAVVVDLDVVVSKTDECNADERG